MLKYAIVFFLAGALSSAKSYQAQSLDAAIIQAIVLAQHKDYLAAQKLFERLYRKTGEGEFLFREAALAILTNYHLGNVEQEVRRWVEKNADSVDGLRTYLTLSLQLQRLDDALRAARRMSTMDLKAEDATITARTFLFTGHYQEAIDVLQKAYRRDGDEAVLLQLVTVLAMKQNRLQEAIGLLSMHIRMHKESSRTLYDTLLSLYVRRNDIDGVISVYRLLYERTKDKEVLRRLMKAYALKGDYEGAADFLERYPSADSQTLYRLYKSLGKFTKAIGVARRLYRTTGDPKWLAEEAIMLYESSQNKHDPKMLQKMISLFDKAIKKGVDDSLYLNYYGYTLIDLDRNVSKGIDLLKQALKQQPDNPYYLDSLAWGYYKQRACKKALDIMQKVVEQEGVKQPEIKSHWEKIRRCESNSSSIGAGY